MFVGTYYNFCGYESKKKLCIDFSLRYPQVHIIEVAFDDEPFVINAVNTTQIRMPKRPGFLTNELVNDYIRENWETLTFICIMDTDLILPSRFFEQVELTMQDNISVPYFVQPFSKTRDVFPMQNVIGQTYESAIAFYSAAHRFSHYTHTGHLAVYNKALLKKLGIELLPTQFILGGYDHILFLCLFRYKEYVMQLINNKEFTKIIMDLYSKLEGTTLGFIAGMVEDHYHGDKATRYRNRWKLYENLNNKVIEDYMWSRNEDQPFILRQSEII